jgi:tRNA-specific 2-thiouridylase
MMPSEKTVVVGMSGGVDSSVAALLLKQQGYRVLGLFMKNWDEASHQSQAHNLNYNQSCPATRDYEDVAAICSQIGIPYLSVNLSKEYKDQVFSEFLRDYEAGYTPNPDVLCNREIKFKVFYEKAKELGGDYLATGHYCQIIDGFLCKGEDPGKDQTYFLNSIPQAVLPHILFPIGHLKKSQVREIAKQNNLLTHSKKDSTGICFIGERNFREFLQVYIPSQPGPFCLPDGTRVGTHQGSCFYTVGQRKKLGLGGEGPPWFVIKKDHKKNIVYVARDGNHPDLFSKNLLVTHLNWLTPEPIEYPFDCSSRIRHRQTDQTCRITQIGNKTSIMVEFNTHQKAAVPGQWITFYKGNRCLGGGQIQSAYPTDSHMAL